MSKSQKVQETGPRPGRMGRRQEEEPARSLPRAAERRRRPAGKEPPTEEAPEGAGGGVALWVSRSAVSQSHRNKLLLSLSSIVKGAPNCREKPRVTVSTRFLKASFKCPVCKISQLEFERRTLTPTVH